MFNNQICYEKESIFTNIEYLRLKLENEELKLKLLNALVDRDKYKNRVIAISRNQQIKNRCPEFEAVNY
tara:strand:- start:263 stop:469 length:207 start_codon:yes stop_codon:yes gene_type:complete